MSNFSLLIDGGAEITVSDNLEDMTTYVLLEQEDWFEPEIKFVRSLAEPGTRAFDIGANHGVYAFSIAALIGRCGASGEGDAAGTGAGGHVWAFEPTRYPLGMLADSVRTNGFEDLVTIVPCALSDRAGTARMGTSALSETNSLHHDRGGSEEVRLDTLDGAWAALGRPAIDFVKLDAEGEEENILKAGRRFFADCSPLVMFEVKSNASHNTALPAAFQALGYGLYRLVPGLGILIPLSPGETLDPFQLNLFACKPDRAAALEDRGLLAGAVAEAVSAPLPVPGAVLAGAPYAAPFAAGWSDVPDEALSQLLAAGEAGRPAAERWSLLRRSLAGFAAARGGGHPVDRLGLIRALRCAGLYGAALQELRSTPLLPPTALASAFAGRPFLPPLPDWDGRPVAGTPESWCAVATADLDNRSRHYSTYFEQGGLSALWAVRREPDLPPPMRRALFLPLLRAGRADRLRDGREELLRPSPGHRNPEVWQALIGRIS